MARRVVDVHEMYRCLEVHMSRRFVELVVRARRFVTRGPGPKPGVPVRRTAHRGAGGELTQFSFRLALMIDLAYVGIGALGGAAVGRATVSSAVAPPHTGCESGHHANPALGDAAADSLSVAERAAGFAEPAAARYAALGMP